MAFNVGTAFDKFCSNLKFTDAKLSTISTRYHSITKRINLDYWNSSSDTAHSLYVGSFGRDTLTQRKSSMQPKYISVIRR